MDTKLQVGSIILVHGWVMLNKLEDSQRYRVAAITSRYGYPVYHFAKPRGNKRIIAHYATDVDLWVGNSSNLNWIEVVGHAIPANS